MRSITPPLTPERIAQTLNNLLQHLEKEERAFKRASDEEFDRWFFCVAKHMEALSDDAWAKTVARLGFDYRKEQLEKLRVVLKIRVASSKTFDQLAEFATLAEDAIKKCPNCKAACGPEDVKAEGNASGSDAEANLEPVGGKRPKI